MPNPESNQQKEEAMADLLLALMTEINGLRNQVTDLQLVVQRMSGQMPNFEIEISNIKPVSVDAPQFKNPIFVRRETLDVTDPSHLKLIKDNIGSFIVVMGRRNLTSIIANIETIERLNKIDQLIGLSPDQTTAKYQCANLIQVVLNNLQVAPGSSS